VFDQNTIICLTHLGMKPHERNNYKSTHFTHTESPYNQLLTDMT